MLKATPIADAVASRALPDRPHCVDCTIRGLAICSDCGEGELDALSAAKSYRHYGPGATIVSMGERTEFLGSLVEGVAGMSRLLADGRRQVVGLLFPGDFIGRPFSHEAPFDVVSLSETRLCAFPRARFETFVREMPSLEHRLLEMTLDELDSAREWMVLLGRKTAREKLASFFALAGRRGARLHGAVPTDGMMIELPLTREDMADFLGLTIETVSRQIGALKKDGLIQLVDARHLHVPSWEDLIDASGGEMEAA
ncbi:MAG: Crp/Fnr family transcriptional regulator [Pseudomonadota bacterium]